MQHSPLTVPNRYPLAYTPRSSRAIPKLRAFAVATMRLLMLSLTHAPKRASLRRRFRSRRFAARVPLACSIERVQ